MRKRKIGHSDLEVSELALGCMSLGTDQNYATQLIDAALDAGINYFDTADLYDKGLNEQFVGNAIKHRRQDLILATKAGNRFETDEEGWEWDPSKKHIKKAVKDSLNRLQTDYIDLYQLHGGTIEDHIDETIEAFEELKQEGVIRYYGISSIRPNVIKEYVIRSSIVSVMMQYSLLDRRPEEWFDLLQSNNISVVARGPLAKGLLTSKPLSAASESIQEKGYLDYSFEELKTLQEQLKTNSTLNRPLSEQAIHYCLAHETVAAVVAGASSIEQIEDNIRAINTESLTREQVDFLKSITKASTYEQHRQ
ncbi:aldo/keto reductase [Alkalihalophilus lindianensis]|uniref:Aldo/keto reductase n=1 Tax=Alkalihalophilus lindianensis TaxID=1630542 RepID=A0ABU3XAJ8_9BACI|nr:aldo/keto reductase [Alkalihalophilus lindianensis]MDV2684908.1 aldo/keto reductase [Alkalihalophilus lindianensis]